MEFFGPSEVLFIGGRSGVGKSTVASEASHLLAEAGVQHAVIEGDNLDMAQDYFDGRINLNEHLIHDVTSTFVVRVSGDSMEGAGISDGDELIVNRALTPKDGSIVIAVLEGELTVKRLLITPRGVVLHAENPAYPDFTVTDPTSLTIFAVAETCLHNLRR